MTELHLDTVRRMRKQFGSDVKLSHDVHERIWPHNAVRLGVALEPYQLCFLEDLLPTENSAWYRQVKARFSTPQVTGQLFTNLNEWLPLVQERSIDFIRCQISKVGGLTQARKFAISAESFGMQTAWQEGMMSDPVKLTASMHLGLPSSNCGVQEANYFSDAELAAFPGHPEFRGGYLCPSQRSGLRIEIDEITGAALGGPADEGRPRYVYEERRVDGTVLRP